MLYALVVTFVVSGGVCGVGGVVVGVGIGVGVDVGVGGGGVFCVCHA